MFFHSTDGNRIIFNAAVEADVILKGMGKRDYDTDMNNHLYTVSFTGYLSDGLNMVTITNVDDYSADKFDKNTTLDSHCESSSISLMNSALPTVVNAK